MTRVYEPINRIILVEPVKEIETSSGLVIPTSSLTDNKRMAYAKVVKLGSGKDPVTGQIIPFSVEVGDIICHRKNCGIELDTGEILMSENEVACRVREE